MNYLAQTYMSAMKETRGNLLEMCERGLIFETVAAEAGLQVLDLAIPMFENLEASMSREIAAKTKRIGELERELSGEATA